MTKLQKEHFEILLENMDGKMSLMLEGLSVLDKKIDDTKAELKEDIAVLDCKIMGLSKRLDSVEERLSAEIAEVRADLNEHRSSTELHQAPRKRPLKRA